MHCICNLLIYNMKMVRDALPCAGNEPAAMKAKAMYRKANFNSLNALLWFGISIYVRDIVFFCAGLLFARIYLF